jgi:hypothetical protein
MVIRFRARPRRSLLPLRSPVRVFDLWPEDAEGISPAWAGGLILSGRARPAGEDLWEAEILPEEERLFRKELGVFAWLTRASYPKSPFVAWIVRVRAWGAICVRFPPGVWVGGRAWPALDRLPPEEWGEAFVERLQERPLATLDLLARSPSQLQRMEGFGDGRANLAAAVGRRFEQEGPAGLILLALHLRGSGQGLAWAVPILESFLEGD